MENLSSVELYSKIKQEYNKNKPVEVTEVTRVKASRKKRAVIYPLRIGIRLTPKEYDYIKSRCLKLSYYLRELLNDDMLKHPQTAPPTRLNYTMVDCQEKTCSSSTENDTNECKEEDYNNE